MYKRVVMFSGGVPSWVAARRTVERHGRDGVALLFTDTLIEDDDLYRFLREAVDDLGLPLERIADGRDPWQVFFDERMLGNSRIDPCSKILKRELARRWLAEHAPGATVVVGIDWSEDHRLPAIRGRYGALGHPIEAPLTEPPYLLKTEMFALARERGIEPPYLYSLGFSHNNCGGFCVKAGQGHFARLLRMLPERYAYHEAKEQEFRVFIGRDVAILRDAQGPLTLQALRERIEAGRQIDLFDIGGCNCFGGDEDAAA